MMYCALNDCECDPWGCFAVMSITMVDVQDCPYAIEMSEETTGISIQDLEQWFD